MKTPGTLRSAWIVLIISANTYFVQASASKIYEGRFLEPVESHFSGSDVLTTYYSKIRKLFFQNSQERPLAQMITLASFQPERMVFLAQKDRTYHLVKRTAAQSIWDSEDLAEVKLNEKKQILPQSTAILLNRLFWRAVSQTRYPQDPIFGADGVTFYFGASEGFYPFREGLIWSPRPDTNCGRLIIIGGLMEKYAAADKSQLKAIASEIDSAAKDLLSDLEKLNTPPSTPSK